MKKIITILILAIGSLSCSAQNNTQPTTGATYLSSPNLIPSASGTWTGTVPGEAGGFSGGGNGPAFNASTNTIIFGYTQKTAAYTYAFNQALQSAGLAIGGYDYSWKINNSDTNSGTLSGKFTLTAINGTPLQTYNYSYNESTGAKDNFITHSGTQWFPQNYSSSNISGFTMEWTGKDSRFWAGYYGPRVREPSIELRYLVDPCSANPLSSPNCPGYAEAYKTQQCTANALYDPTCPGYAAALKTQQCTTNPMSDSTCPNYQTYLNEQCLKDSLFSKLCEGYNTAYAIKYIVPLDSVVTNAVNQQLTTTNEIVKSDPTKVTIVNTTVDSVLNTPSTTSVSPTSVTSVINQSPSPTSGAPPIAAATTAASAPPPPPPPAKQEERAQEQKKTDVEVAKVERGFKGDEQGAKKEIGLKAVQITENAAKASTMEAQIASQGLLVGLIGYVPGFTGYQQAIIQDVNALEMAKKYSKPVVDNARAQRRLSGGNEERWRQMVDSQYNN